MSLIAPVVYIQLLFIKSSWKAPIDFLTRKFFSPVEKSIRNVFKDLMYNLLLIFKLESQILNMFLISKLFLGYTLR